jgi:hypothetical protein
VSLLSHITTPLRVSLSVPPAWDGSPIADVYPPVLTFWPVEDEGGSLNHTPQSFAVHPRNACEGDYHISLAFEYVCLYPAGCTCCVVCHH